MTAPPAASPPRREILGSAVGQLLHRLDSYVPTDTGKGDRGKLAALRRGAGKKLGEVNDAMMVYLRDTTVDLYDDEVEDLYTVATLFAWGVSNGDPTANPRSRQDRAFGASLSWIRNREDGNEEDEGVSRRFAALLNSRAEGVPTHLRHLIVLLHSRTKHWPPSGPRLARINYSQLFFDLRDWGAPDRRVQRAWAAGFWRRGTSSADATTPANDEHGGGAATTEQED